MKLDENTGWALVDGEGYIHMNPSRQLCIYETREAARENAKIEKGIHVERIKLCGKEEKE